MLGLLAGGSPAVLIVSELALGATCLVVSARAKVVPLLPDSRDPILATATGATGLVFALSVALLGFSRHAVPFGGWDSWSIWTLHARFLHRGRTGAWVDMFSPLIGWSHPDYPLLVPATIARTWSITGSEGAFVPWFVALVSTLGLPLLVFGVLRRIRGPLVGAIGALAIVASPRIVRIGAEQYADVPLAGAFAATIAFLTLAGGAGSRRTALLVLAGVTASVAAWTKNEGAPFAIAAIALSPFLGTGSAPASRFRDAAAVLAGALPGLVALGLYRAFLAPAETVFGGAFAGLARKCLDAERHRFVLAAARAEILEHYALVLGLLALAVLLLGPATRPERNAAFPGLGLVAIQAAVYYAVYIVTPLDQQWHTSNSIHRLFVQLAPSGILGLLLLAAEPGRGHPPPRAGAPA
ncbi:MAG: glycosyltransferase family 39 protein [Holophagales bacterium]|nr:glycosyltransferase family 39 protein [Holophagales bacterium]